MDAPAHSRRTGTRGTGDAAARGPRSHGGAGRSRGGDAARGQAGAYCCACPELRTAGDDTVGNSGTEDTKAKQSKGREHQRHGVFDGRLFAAETGSELRKQRGTNTNDDSEHQHLDAG